MIHESQNIDVIFYSVMMLLMGEMIRIALSYSQLSTNKLSSPFTTRAAQTLWRQFLDKPVMLDDDLAWRPWKNWILYGPNFLWHGTFHDAVKEFNIVKYFGLKHIKTDSRRIIAKCRSKKCTWLVHAPINKGVKSFSIKKSCSEHTWNIRVQEKIKSKLGFAG